jgi:hypothetical protein
LFYNLSDPSIELMVYLDIRLCGAVFPTKLINKKGWCFESSMRADPAFSDVVSEAR